MKGIDNDVISRKEAIQRVSDALKGVFVENEDVAHQLLDELSSPTLDVREVIRAKWIPANGTYYCSHYRHYAWDTHRFPFCQDCGAKMEVEK